MIVTVSVKVITILMVTPLILIYDTLMAKMDCTPILSIKVSINKIKTAVHKNCDFDGRCKRSLKQELDCTLLSIARPAGHWNVDSPILRTSLQLAE